MLKHTVLIYVPSMYFLVCCIHSLERLKGIVENGKILVSSSAMIFPEEAGFVTASRIKVTAAFRIEFRKGVYRYAFMNLISMGQVHVQDYIGFKAVLADPHISVLQPPQIISYHTTLIKTAKYGWNVTDEKSCF